MDHATSPQSGRISFFGRFTVDRSRGVLTRDGEVVALRPKAWEVLLLLLDRPGELLSLDAILDVVWSGVAVTPKTLANVIGELRRALSDDAEHPLYIETVHRRGYRFIGVGRVDRATPVTTAKSVASLIGRSSELDQLAACWQQACAGESQIAFVVGEPGIGKTRLVEEFLLTLRRTPGAGDAGGGTNEPLIAMGQCLERHGAHEAYMPLLDAIASLASDTDSDTVRSLLELYAPTWIQQIPWLLATASRAQLDSEIRAFGSARMLREGTQFLYALAERHPVALVLEDMHWADPETVDFVAALTRRTQPARILLIATYRIAEARLYRHPIVKVADDACRKGFRRISMENFSQEEIVTFLEQYFPDPHFALELAKVVESHSSGNPLFVRATVDHLVDSGKLTRESGSWRPAEATNLESLDLPDTVRGALDAQIDLLADAECELLKVAAVIGDDFTIETVAAGLAAPSEEVETTLENLLSQSQFICHATSSRPATSAPGSHFAFVHSLYKKVLYDRLTAPQRRLLHQRIGEHLERICGDTINPAVLADHFDRSRDHARAAAYLELCAAAAARRFADRERLRYLERAYAHLEHMPESSDRAAIAMRLHIGIGEAVSALAGPQDERVAAAARHALALCAEVDDPRALYVALHGLWLFSTMRGDFITNQPLLERATKLAQANPRPELIMLAEMQLGTSACFRGTPEDGLPHLEAAAALLSQIDDDWLPVTIPEIRVEIQSALAWNLWLVGRPDQALQHARQSYDHAIQRRDVISSIVASIFLSNVHTLRGEFDDSLVVAKDLQAMGDEFDVDAARWTGKLLEAAVFVERLELDKAFATIASIGVSESDPGLQQMVRTYFISRLAHACGRLGNPQQGLIVLAEADVRIARSGSPISEAEVWRVRGELAQLVDTDILIELKLVADQSADPTSYAEHCLERAIEIARRQRSSALELRATTSLAHLWKRQGRMGDAHQALRAIYDRFSEGFDTADLRAAKALLDQLSPG